MNTNNQKQEQATGQKKLAFLNTKAYFVGKTAETVHFFIQDGVVASIDIEKLAVALAKAKAKKAELERSKAAQEPQVA